jgi:glycosyltransferase involved in cell wall biosynthesis
MSKKILYVQHTSALGGSALSLLYTIQALDGSSYEPVVALLSLNGDLRRLYESAGIPVIYWPGIRLFQHTTAHWWSLSRPFDWIATIQFATSWRNSLRRTAELVRDVRPDIVHLNSVVLAPAAVALSREGIPFVWHVRESPVPGYFGLRYRLLRGWLSHLGNEVIFISNYDRQSWVQGKRGIVVYNFVDFAQFNRDCSREASRRMLGIPQNAKVVLYVGGLWDIKGIIPLLKALAIVQKQTPDLVCLMPGTVRTPSRRLVSQIGRKVLWALGAGVLWQQVEQIIQASGLQETVWRMSFQRDIVPLYAACDLLVFPSLQPHFPRPVIEAGAMAKPVVASDIGGVAELVEDGKTGILVPPNQAQALAKAMMDILNDEQLAQQMGEAGYQRARELYDAKRNTQYIMQIYQGL